MARFPGVLQYICPMIMQNINKMEFYKLCNSLDTENLYECYKFDASIAKNLSDIDKLLEMYWHFSRKGLSGVLIDTRIRINELLNENFKTKNLIRWWVVYSLLDWLELEAKENIIGLWLNGQYSKLPLEWIHNLIEYGETNLSSLSKIIESYKKSKNQTKAALIEKIFKKISNKDLIKACEMLKKQSPAISASLLCREVSPQYTLIGLKSLSKLSKFKKIHTKIDFQLLNELKPDSRLDALNHLTTNPLPFKMIPKRTEMEKLMFSTSFKQFKKVSAILSRFDKIIEQQTL